MFQSGSGVTYLEIINYFYSIHCIIGLSKSKGKKLKSFYFLVQSLRDRSKLASKNGTKISHVFLVNVKIETKFCYVNFFAFSHTKKFLLEQFAMESRKKWYLSLVKFCHTRLRLRKKVSWFFTFFHIENPFAKDLNRHITLNEKYFPFDRQLINFPHQKIVSLAVSKINKFRLNTSTMDAIDTQSSLVNTKRRYLVILKIISMKFVY